MKSRDENVRHIVPISGKDSLATALFLVAKNPGTNFEFMFNPTGAELPEVFDWLANVERYLKKPIVKVGEDLRSIINIKKKGFLPSQYHRYCTQESKIKPMEEFIGDDECFVYYGIRADEDRIGYVNKSKRNIIPVYPLKEAGINLALVYQIVSNAGLKPPAFLWQSVYKEVCKRFGGESKLNASISQRMIDILFTWRTRMNCFFCFNQRKYEWVGLLEHHPDLFWEAEKMEHNGSEYYWNGKDYPLTKIVERKDSIKENRVKSIVKFLGELAINRGRYRENSDDKEFIDILSVTSCGLLCGK